MKYKEVKKNKTLDQYSSTGEDTTGFFICPMCKGMVVDTDKCPECEVGVR